MWTLKPAWANIGGRLRTGVVLRGWPRLLELCLIAILTVQIVRLVWVAVTPVGPLGDWRGRGVALPSAQMQASLFRSFDAFYPSPVAEAGAGTQNVTSLPLNLFGVRINEGSGLGSAIIGAEDGVQGSYAVGDEVQPGVTLKSVHFDHVVIDRGGIEETIFLDQSDPVTPVAPADAPRRGAVVSGVSPKSLKGVVTADSLKTGIALAPRMSEGRVTGLLVTPSGPGFHAAGFRDGDVITQVNGRAVGSASDLAALQQGLVPGARLSVMVERGADVVPIAVIVQDK
ncbi:MAG: type II secretion system protein N [Sphingobium sp.]